MGQMQVSQLYRQQNSIHWKGTSSCECCLGKLKTIGGRNGLQTAADTEISWH